MCDCEFPTERLIVPQSGIDDKRASSRWRCMLYRCYNPDNKDFKNYGGRGILVCKQWQESFHQYNKDVGPKPHGMTLDRRDNEGHYCPHNTMWVDNKTQAQNKRWHGVKTDLPKGVTKRPHIIKRPYMAQIRINGKLKFIGYFDTAEKAGEAYITAKESSEELHQ